MSFISANITTDPGQLVDDALDQLNTLLAAAGLPGWDSADADLLVIFLNTVAQIAADTATTAATVLPAIFRAYGTQLLGIPYQNGTTASVTSTWTFTAPAPDSISYGIDGGTAVIVSGETFYTAEPTVVSIGESSASILLVASQTGTAYNGLGGINDGYPDVQLLNGINYVATVVTNAVSSGGTDQETDDNYQNRLQAVLQLQAPRPITASDFAAFVDSDIAETATGVAVGRSTAIDGYYPVARALSTGGTGPAPLTLAGTLTSSSPTVAVTAPPYPFSVPYPGASVTGTNVPAGATVLSSPAPSATAFTMSGNATAAGGETLTVSAFQNVERCVTVFVTDAQGNALTAAQMDALQTWLDSYREENFLVYVEPPSYNQIYVTAEVHVLPNFVGQEASVTAAVQAALASYLNPYTWGNTELQADANSWLNATSGFNVVRYTSLYGVIEGVQGVQYVDNSTLFLGMSANPTGTSDLTMTGPAPLPLTSTANLHITADN